MEISKIILQISEGMDNSKHTFLNNLTLIKIATDSFQVRKLLFSLLVNIIIFIKMRRDYQALYN